MQQMGMPQNGQPIITNQMQPMVIKSVWMCLWRYINEIIIVSFLSPLQTANAYIASVPASNPYNPYFAPGQLVPTILGPDPGSTATVSQQIGPCVPQPVPMPPQQKLPQHTDRIEVSYYSYWLECKSIDTNQSARRSRGVEVLFTICVHRDERSVGNLMIKAISFCCCAAAAAV